MPIVNQTEGDDDRHGGSLLIVDGNEQWAFGEVLTPLLKSLAAEDRLN